MFEHTRNMSRLLSFSTSPFTRATATPGCTSLGCNDSANYNNSLITYLSVNSFLIEISESTNARVEWSLVEFSFNRKCYHLVALVRQWTWLLHKDMKLCELPRIDLNACTVHRITTHILYCHVGALWKRRWRPHVAFRRHQVARLDFVEEFLGLTETQARVDRAVWYLQT